GEIAVDVIEPPTNVRRVRFESGCARREDGGPVPELRDEIASVIDRGACRSPIARTDQGEPPLQLRHAALAIASRGRDGEVPPERVAALGELTKLEVAAAEQIPAQPVRNTVQPA